MNTEDYMKTFKEFVAKKLTLDEENSEISGEISNIVNKLAQKNPKVVPGLTQPKDITTAMTDTNVQNLIKKNPQAAGDIGAVLGGKNAVNKIK